MDHSRTSCFGCCRMVKRWVNGMDDPFLEASASSCSRVRRTRQRFAAKVLGPSASIFPNGEPWRTFGGCIDFCRFCRSPCGTLAVTGIPLLFWKQRPHVAIGKRTFSISGVYKVGNVVKTHVCRDHRSLDRKNSTLMVVQEVDDGPYQPSKRASAHGTTRLGCAKMPSCRACGPTGFLFLCLFCF